MAYGAATVRVAGAKMKARYMAATVGTRILIVRRRQDGRRSRRGERMAEERRPVRMRRAPVMPAWVSV